MLLGPFFFLALSASQPGLPATQSRVLAAVPSNRLPTAFISGVASEPVAASRYASQAEQRTLNIAYRLATLGRAECLQTVPLSGLLLRHLAQFELADREREAKSYGMRQGPMIAAIAQGSPAAEAGLRAGDVVTLIQGRPIAPYSGLDQPFNQEAAQAYADKIDASLSGAGSGQAVRVSVLRGHVPITIAFVPAVGCRSIVHLARSDQKNAYADGRHVFLTSKIAELAREDSELAFVLGHEMAHNILHHADRLRAEGVGKGPFRALGKGGQIVRETERQADLLGADLMLDAGYDPVMGARVLKLVDSSPFRIAIVGEHDSASQRSALIRAHVESRMRSASAQSVIPATH